MSRKGKCMETKGRLVVAWGWKWEYESTVKKKNNKRINYKWAQGHLTEGDENVLKLMMVAVPLSKVI